MPDPTEKPKPGPAIIWNPPEGRDDEATLIAVLAPIIARLCAVPAPVVEPLKKRRSKR